MTPELKELTKTFNLFIQENTKVVTKLEVNQGHLVNAFKELSDTIKETVKSNERLEIKVVSLEERALNKITLMEDSLNETNHELVHIDKRVQVIELINANNSGKEEVRTNTKKFWQDNWFKFFSMLVLLMPALAAIYKIVKAGKLPL